MIPRFSIACIPLAVWLFSGAKLLVKSLYPCPALPIFSCSIGRALCYSMDPGLYQTSLYPK